MAVIVFIDSQANGAGGGDVIPAAMDWGDVAISSGSGVETTNEVTVSGISSPIVLRASWTSSSSSPTKAQWLSSGVSVQPPALTYVEVTAINGAKLKWQTYAGYTHPSGNYDAGTVTITNETRNKTVTMTIASPGVVTWTGHGFVGGERILFRTTGALPTGVTAGTIYYVLAAGITSDTFQFSATDGGAAINTSGTQSGVHTGVSVVDTLNYACQYVRTGGGGGGGGGGYSEPPEIA